VSLKAGIERIARMMDKRNERIRYLERRVVDAETALCVWDAADSSEYWERYPKRMGEELSTGEER
jgi:hypothetical protein